MSSYRNILVAVHDLRARQNPAIERAARIAAGCRARLVLFHDLATPVYLSPFAGASQSTASITRAARRNALKRLELMAEPLRAKGIKVTTSAEWDYPPYEAIVRRAAAVSADLIVANKRKHHRLPALLAQTDWELLRASPTPVLLVKGGRYRARAPIVAAVDPLHTNAKPADLDPHILRHAVVMAAALNSSVHAVQVTPSWEPVEAGSGKASRAQIDALMRAAKVTPARMHLLAGLPDELIPRTARRLRAGVVVLGMMSRRGLKRFFIGNTAERLIDSLHCDLLVVKPRQFHTRVPRARRGIFFLSSMPLA